MIDKLKAMGKTRATDYIRARLFSNPERAPLRADDAVIYNGIRSFHRKNKKLSETGGRRLPGYFPQTSRRNEMNKNQVAAEKARVAYAASLWAAMEKAIPDLSVAPRDGIEFNMQIENGIVVSIRVI